MQILIQHKKCSNITILSPIIKLSTVEYIYIFKILELDYFCKTFFATLNGTLYKCLTLYNV